MRIGSPDGRQQDIDVGEWTLKRSVDPHVIDYFEFHSEFPLAMRSDIEVGGFCGPLSHRKSIGGGVVRHVALCRHAYLQHRQTFPGFYGAGHPDHATTRITLSTVLSSDSPSQDAGADQYVVGLLWGMNSLVWPEIGRWSGGIWTGDGAGTASRIGEADIYYSGRLCSEVEAPGDLAGGTFRFYRDEDALMVKGAGTGDIFGPIHADNAFDTGLRLGSIENDDYIFGAIQIGLRSAWDLISEIVRSHGQYIHFRDNYIDISTSPPGRGSCEEPFAEIGEDDIISWEILSSSAPPPVGFLGLGRGDQYSRLSPSAGGGPMILDLIDTHESHASPWGGLSDLIDGRYARSRAEAKIQILTGLDYFEPGDWITARLSPSFQPTGQIFRTEERSSGEFLLMVGGTDGIMEDVFLQPGYDQNYARKFYGVSTYAGDLKSRQLGTVYINGYINRSGADNYPRMCSDADGYLYIADPKAYTLSKIDAATKKIVKWVSTEHVARSGIACDGEFIYTQSAVFGLNLDLVATHSTWGGSSYTDIDVNSSYIYVADYSANAIKRYNKSTYEYIDSFSAINYGYVCTCDDNYLYCLNGANIYRYAADNPASSIHVSAADYGQPYGMIYDGSKLYIVSIHPFTGQWYFVRFSSALALESQVTTVNRSYYCAASDKNDPEYFYVLSTPGTTYSAVHKIKKSTLTYQDGFGQTTMPAAFSMNFTPKNFAGSPGRVSFDLECTKSGTYPWGSIAGTFKVYVNDVLAAIFRNRPVTGTPIQDFDVAPWLKLDGSAENIKVWLDWSLPLETISFSGKVTGTKGYL